MRIEKQNPTRQNRRTTCWWCIIVRAESRCIVQDIEQKIREVNATMAMEGMPLTESDKEDMRKVLRGEISFAEMRKRILADYQPKMISYERI
jgi:hypothetical protein